MSGFFGQIYSHGNGCYGTIMVAKVFKMIVLVFSFLLICYMIIYVSKLRRGKLKFVILAITENQVFLYFQIIDHGDMA